MMYTKISGLLARESVDSVRYTATHKVVVLE